MGIKLLRIIGTFVFLTNVHIFTLAELFAIYKSLEIIKTLNFCNQKCIPFADALRLIQEIIKIYSTIHITQPIQTKMHNMRERSNIKIIVIWIHSNTKRNTLKKPGRNFMIIQDT